ncbi:MAG: transporter substrate-binding domain-containing protein [Peptoniphilaceae bacterium]
MKFNIKKISLLSLAITMVLPLVSCGNKDVNQASESSIDNNELKVGMECMYAPYNWTQKDDSNGAVKIEDSNQYACGYDVEIAKKIADGLGKELKIVKTEWDGLPPAVQSGKIDVIIAGMSPTEDRRQNMDFSSPYWQSELIMIVKEDSKFANAESLSDFSGAKITGQLNTVHYSVIDQIEGAIKEEAMGDFMQERIALQSGKIDAYVAETPEGISVKNAMPGFTYVSFDKEEGFKTEDTERQVAVGLKKGSSLTEEINKIIESISEEDRQKLMEEAIINQPTSN